MLNSVIHQTELQKAQLQPVALFVSDIHLHASLPKTTEAFLNFLRTVAVHAKQVYVLGDLFEYWAGDDDMVSAYNQMVINALHAVSKSGVALFWIAGNRDFLTGEEFGKETGATLLPDPYVTQIAGHKIVLVHGDAQCTDDTAYMAFRAQVRATNWRQEFLAMPLTQRKAIIDNMRQQSRQAQSLKSYEIMDVNQEAVASLFKSSGADIMIHGHTHRPGCHEYEFGGVISARYVLPDWDCDGEHSRGGWLGITANGEIHCYALDGSEQL